MTISLCFRRVIISLFQSVGCLALKRNASAPNRNGRPHKPHSSGHGSGRKLILKAKTLCYLFIAVFVCPVRKECGKLLRGPSRFRCTTNIARCNPGSRASLSANQKEKIHVPTFTGESTEHRRMIQQLQYIVVGSTHPSFGELLRGDFWGWCF